MNIMDTVVRSLVMVAKIMFVVETRVLAVMGVGMGFIRTQVDYVIRV